MPDDGFEDLASQLGAVQCGLCHRYELQERIRQVSVDAGEAVLACQECQADLLFGWD